MSEPTISSHTISDLFAKVRELIRAKLVEHALPSLAVAVARNGGVLWEEGFGWADREQRVPASEHTMYSLASVSKPITTTALMILQERGKLDLDTPVNDYLGSAGVTARVGSAAEATVRHVANHTSGLPVHYHLFFEDEPYRRPPMEETIRRYGNLITAPGERYQYSNLGYGILDHLLARLSGRSYADFLRQELFQPLGMFRSSVDVGPGLEPFAAARYGRDGLRVPWYDFDHPGASAVFSSAHDLVRFGMFHLQERLSDQKPVLTPETLNAMQVPTTRTEGNSGYGIGWQINEDMLGYRTVNHGGGMVGVSTGLILVPAERIAIVTLANASCDLPHLVFHEILSALLPDYAERRARAEAEKKPDSEASSQTPTPVETDPELQGEWRGSVHTYQGEMPLTLWFKEGGDIHAQLGSQLKTLLNEVRLEEGRLTGRMFGEIETEEAMRRRHHLHVGLIRRGAVLNGRVSTFAQPGARGGMDLSHWVELQKQQG